MYKTISKNKIFFQYITIWTIILFIISIIWNEIDLSIQKNNLWDVFILFTVLILFFLALISWGKELINKVYSLLFN